MRQKELIEHISGGGATIEHAAFLTFWWTVIRKYGRRFKFEEVGVNIYKITKIC